MPRKLRPSRHIEPVREPRPREVIHSLFVSCPLCAMSRKLEKSGRLAKLQGKPLDTVKGRVHFGTFDLEDSYLVQVRDCSGSRGHGFPMVGGYTLKQLKTMPEFAEMLAELKATCQSIVDSL